MRLALNTSRNFVGSLLVVWPVGRAFRYVLARALMSSLGSTAIAAMYRCRLTERDRHPGSCGGRQEVKRRYVIR